MKYYAAAEEENIEKLEAEGQVDEPVDEDDDEGEEDARSDGQLVYEVLKKRGLVDEGNFEDLALRLRRGWDQYAAESCAGDVRDEMIEELS